MKGLLHDGQKSIYMTDRQEKEAHEAYEVNNRVWPSEFNR